MAPMKVELLRSDPEPAESFESIYRSHSGRVYAICLRMTRDETRAREITQDVFVRTWQKLGSFRGEGELGGWIRKITVNLVLNAIRSDRRRTARVETTDVLERYDRGRTDGSPESRIGLERAIAALPAGARAVFVLHDVEGYKHEEIAERMGIAVGTAKAQLHRARKLLREAMA